MQRGIYPVSPWIRKLKRHPPTPCPPAAPAGATAPTRTAPRFWAGSGTWSTSTAASWRASRAPTGRQDAFQTFLTLPAAHPLVEAGDESRRLLITLTRNVARNSRRLHAHARPHVGDPELIAGLPAAAAGADELIAAAEDRIRLHRCVQTLADVQRAVVTLRMLDEVPGDDVAQALGITPGHVAVLLHRAKVNLLSCMTR